VPGPPTLPWRTIPSQKAEIRGPIDMRMKRSIRIITTIAMKLFPLIGPPSG